MSIDAISTNTSASVGAIDTLTHDLSDQRRRREASQLAADDQQETAQQEATIVTISDEVMAERRLADALVLHDTTDAGRKLAGSIADRRDTGTSAAHVDGAVVQEAIDALREASRENADVNAEAIGVDKDRATDFVASDRDAVATGANEQGALQVDTTNAGIQVSYGGLPSTVTGDAPLRQPGLSVFA